MRCANPICNAEALYFRSGSLHWVDATTFYGEEQMPRMQMIWLCAECSRFYVVETWRPAGQQVRRRESIPQKQESSGFAPIRDAISVPASKSAEAF